MITYKEWFVILSLATRVLGQGSEVRTPAPEFSFELNPTTIQPGEHATLTLTTPLGPEADEATVQVNDDLLTHQPGLSLLEKTVERTKQGLVYRYQLTSYKDSVLSVPPVELRKTGATFSTESRSLTIKSTRAEEDQEIREGFSHLKPPKPWGKWAKMGSIIVALLGGAYYLYNRFRRKPIKLPQMKKFSLPVPVPKPNHEAWLKIRMQEIQQRLIKEPDNEFLIDEWSLTIREYYTRTTQSPARSWTTAELKKAYQDRTSFVPIVPHLENCDNFRFRNPNLRKRSLKEILSACIQETEKTLIACGA